MRRRLVGGVAFGLFMLVGLNFFVFSQGMQTLSAVDHGSANAAYLQAIEATSSTVVPTAPTLPAEGQRTPQPVTTKEPPFNYTRTELDAAQAKWLSQGAIEYEEVVTYDAFSLFSGTWKLHVRVSSGLPRVVSYERDLSQGGKQGGAVTASDLEFLTIEQMFLRLDQAISGSQPGGPGDGSFPVYYKATFDPAMGYPTLFESDDNSLPPMVADVGFKIKVHSVNILGTALPGMPSTGHP